MISIDDLVTQLNIYLNQFYTKPSGDVTAIQANLDNRRVKEPYVTVERGSENIPSRKKTREKREDDPEGIKVTFSRNDKSDLIIQSYDKSIEVSKELINKVYNWFMFILENDPNYSVRDLTDITPNRFTIAKETINTFVFTVTLEEVETVEAIEQKIEGVEFIVNE